MNWKDIKGQKRSVEQEASNYRWAHTRTTSTDADYWHCSQLIHGECIKPPLAFWGHYQHLITLLITRLVNEDVNGSCRRSTNEIKPQKEPRKRRHLNSKFKSMFRMPPDSRRLQLARRQRLNIYMYVCICGIPTQLAAGEVGILYWVFQVCGDLGKSQHCPLEQRIRNLNWNRTETCICIKL